MIDDLDFPKAPEGVTGATLRVDPDKVTLKETGWYLLTTLLKLRDSAPHTVRIGADAGFVCINIAPAVFRQKESMN